MPSIHAMSLAVAQPAPGSLEGFMAGPVLQFLPLVAIFLMFYLLYFRPQQRRMREHAARIGAIKRGDTVVLSSGLIGKVVRVEEAEVGLEVAQNVTVKGVKARISAGRARGEPAPANDSKS